jgi:TonB family protein
VRGIGGKRGVTLSETLDNFAVVIRDGVISDSAAVDDDRPEPSLAAAPFFIEFDEPARLDPERAGLIWELQPASVRTIRLRSPMASLAFHLLPALGLVIWPLVAIEPPAPIPVQLVFEQPPPPPPPPQAAPQPQPPPPKMQTGRLSSVDMGDIKTPDLGRTPDPVPAPSAGEQQPDPTETHTATATPRPPVPLPKPAPPKEHQAAFQLPKPSGAPVERHEEIPHEASHSARYAGPASTRDEYLAYLVSLTRQHMDLLPMSVVGDRRGETVISVVVYDNGTIGQIGVIRSSNYPDIDKRIEQMVAAVHKFPPLPQWYQGNAVQLELTLKFPEALEQR